jgi:hypothetical protein
VAVEELLLGESMLETDLPEEHSIAGRRDVARCLADEKRVVVRGFIGGQSLLVFIADSERSPQFVPPAMLEHPAERNEDMPLDRGVPRGNDVQAVAAGLVILSSSSKTRT